MTGRNKRHGTWLVLLMIALLGLTACVAATPVEAPKQKLMSIGAVSSVSDNYMLAVHLANAINSELPDIKINVLETAGGTDNLKRLAQGEIELALAGLSGIDNALFGEGPFAGNAVSDVRLMFNTAVMPFHFIVRADSNIQTLQDLKGQPFNPSAVGTSTEKDIERILQAVGAEANLVRGSHADGVQFFRDRRIVGFAKGGRVPESVVTEISVTTPIRLLSLSPQDRAKVEAALPFIPIVTIPGGSYQGITSDVTAGAVINSYASRTGVLSAEEGYRVVKAVYNFRETIQRSFPGFEKDFHKLTIAGGRVPLHPGVVRFLKEDLGMEVPKHLIPPEYSR